MRSTFALIPKLLTLLVGFSVSAQEPDTLNPSAVTPNDTLILVTDTLEPEAAEGALEEPVNYNARDSIILDVPNGVAHLYYDAHVDYGDIKLKAGYISIDFNTDIIVATGIRDSVGRVIQKPIFTEQGKDYASDTIRYNFKSRKASIKTITTQEGEGYIHGDQVKMIDQRTFYIRDVSFTTCNLEHPHFDIIARKAKVIAGEKVITGPAFFRVADVITPLFVPFGYFPMQNRRTSGLIIPNYTDQANRGFGLLGLGYYWAVNDYLDLLATGDIYTRGSWAVRVGSNYRVRYRYNGNVSLNYSRNRFGDPRYEDDGSFEDKRDFGFTWQHNQDPKARPDLRFSANVNVASSTYYRNNTTDPGSFLQNSFQSAITMAKTWQGSPFNLNVSARHQQNNAAETFTLSMPEVVLSMNRIQPFSGDGVGDQKWYERIGLTYNLQARSEVRDSTLAYSDPARILERDRLRYGARHSVSISTNEKLLRYFTLTPSMNYNMAMLPRRYTYAWDEDAGNVDVDTIGGFNMLHTMNVRANVTTKIYGLFNFRGRLKAIRHVATPTVGLSYTPDFETDFWNYYETVQINQNGDEAKRFVFNNLMYASSPGSGGGAVNFNLMNNLDAKWKSSSDSTGEKKFALLERLTLATTYRMQQDSFAWAPLQVSANNTFWGGKVGVNYQGTFDFYGVNKKGVRVSQTALEQNGKLLRNTVNTLSFDFRLQGGERGQSQAATGPLGLQSADPNYYRIYDYMDVSALWTLTASYSYQTRLVGLERDIVQTTTISGSIEPTPNWRLGFSTGYDLVNNGLSYTTIDLKRELHCWELSIRWVPFGFNRSYTIGIRAKANMFQDLKYERNRRRGEF